MKTLKILGPVLLAVLASCGGGNDSESHAAMPGMDRSADRVPPSVVVDSALRRRLGSVISPCSTIRAMER